MLHQRQSDAKPLVQYGTGSSAYNTASLLLSGAVSFEQDHHIYVAQDSIMVPDKQAACKLPQGLAQELHTVNQLWHTTNWFTN